MGSDAQLESVQEVPVKGHVVQVRVGSVIAPLGEAPDSGAVLLSDRDCELSGELLAVEPDAIWIQLDEKDSRKLGSDLARILLPSVDELTIQLHDSKGTLLGVATTVGSLSTLSHGYFLILSLPTWLVTGIASTKADSAASHLDVDTQAGVYLYQFARFPQGLPESFKRREFTTARCR